jgi:hypothetical protein
MKKLYAVIPFLFIGIVLFFSCGGGGVSEQFTKELNEFETAWNNTAASFTAVMDSVKTTNDAFTSCTGQMKVPDTLTEKLTGTDTQKLDSIKANCGKYAQGVTDIMNKLETYKTGWDKEAAAFAGWKDKVLKGSIDIETAKKDLKIYKEKLDETAKQSDEAYNGLTELKGKCDANCSLYDGTVKEIAGRVEEPKNHRRGR